MAVKLKFSRPTGWFTLEDIAPGLEGAVNDVALQQAVEANASGLDWEALWFPILHRLTTDFVYCPVEPEFKIDHETHRVWVKYPYKLHVPSDCYGKVIAGMPTNFLLWDIN